MQSAAMARTSASDIDRTTMGVAPLSAMMTSQTASSGSQRRSRAISSTKAGRSAQSRRSIMNLERPSAA